MSLTEKALAARLVADQSNGLADHALADGLEAAVNAAACEQLAELRDEPDLSGLPEPPVSHIAIPGPPVEN